MIGLIDGLIIARDNMHYKIAKPFLENKILSVRGLDESPKIFWRKISFLRKICYFETNVIFGEKRVRSVIICH